MPTNIVVLGALPRAGPRQMNIRKGESVPTEDRFFHRLTQGKLVTLFDVRRLARYASHMTMDGHLYEFDQGRFWHTNLLEHEPGREPVDDDPDIPVGPWYHHAMCDCVFCRPTEE